MPKASRQEKAEPLSESDGELLRRCRLGDESAWHGLVQRYTRKVFGVAYRFTGRVDEAEDITQEIFVKVYQGLDRFREAEGSFPAWLTTLARNHAVDHYRRRREERLRDIGDPDAMLRVAAGGDSPLRLAERAERAQIVHRGLRALPTELREVLILCDLEGMQYQEISEALRLPLGTVKSRINRARLELAKRLLAQRGDLA